MNWDKFTAWIDQFTNKPLVYGIFIVLVSFACAFILFSQTSIGKKTLNKLTNLYKLGHEKANDTLKKVENVETLAKEKIAELEAQYEQKINDLTAAYEEKVATLISIVNFYEESFFAVLEKIPNAKVQDEIANLRENYESKKKEISDVIGVIYQDYTLILQNKEKQIRKEYDEKVAFLENEIKRLSLYLNEIKKPEEDNDGQGEETINSNTTEEALQETGEGL